MYYLEFVDLPEKGEKDVLMEPCIERKVYEDKESKVFSLDTTLDTYDERGEVLSLLEKYKEYKPSFTKYQEEKDGEN